MKHTQKEKKTVERKMRRKLESAATIVHVIAWRCLFVRSSIVCTFTSLLCPISHNPTFIVMRRYSQSWNSNEEAEESVFVKVPVRVAEKGREIHMVHYYTGECPT